MAPTDHYQLVPQSLDINEKEELLEPQRSPSGWRFAGIVLGSVSLVSILLNFWFLYRQSTFRDFQIKSRYAGLRWDVPTEILYHTPYDSLNRTIQDAVWDAPELEPWANFVALDDEYVDEMDLPSAQRWPWDMKKGVYVLTAAHELHCVRILRIFVNENHDGVPEAGQTWAYQHVMHCLNVLRESVMCNANDEPLYIGRLHKQVHEANPRAGIGEFKMCRNWSQMVEWSRQRSACYKPIQWFEEGVSEFERYKYCPDGTKPWEEPVPGQ